MAILGRLGLVIFVVVCYSKCQTFRLSTDVIKVQTGFRCLLVAFGCFVYALSFFYLNHWPKYYTRRLTFLLQQASKVLKRELEKQLFDVIILFKASTMKVLLVNSTISKNGHHVPAFTPNYFVKVCSGHLVVV